MKRPYTVEEIKKVAVPIAQRHGVGKLALFGSYAKNTAVEYSDIDFLVDKGSICGAWEFAGFIMDLEDALDIDVDVLTYNSAKRSKLTHIIENEVMLYEQQG